MEFRKTLMMMSRFQKLKRERKEKMRRKVQKTIINGLTLTPKNRTCLNRIVLGLKARNKKSYIRTSWEHIHWTKERHLMPEIIWPRNQCHQILRNLITAQTSKIKVYFKNSTKLNWTETLLLGRERWQM